jgi:hypothetical protein
VTILHVEADDWLMGTVKFGEVFPVITVYGLILVFDMVINQWEMSLRGEFSINI